MVKGKGERVNEYKCILHFVVITIYWGRHLMGKKGGVVNDVCRCSEEKRRL